MKIYINIILVIFLFFAIVHPLEAQDSQEEESTDYIKLTNSFIQKFRKNINRRSVKRLRPMFSPEATVIVGTVGGKKKRKIKDNESVFYGKSGEEYASLSGKDYVDHLGKVFKKNSWVKVTFSDSEILQHDIVPNILSVTTRQKWKSQRYSDVGWLYVIVDFSNLEKPKIVLRLWQIDKMDGKEYFDEYASLFLPDSLLIDSTALAPIEPLPGEIKEFALDSSGTTISMAWIPSGEYLTSGLYDKLAGKDELPLRSFEIDKGFWLSQFEVTEAQWQAVTEGYTTIDSIDIQYPETGVSWDEISDKFLNHLNSNDSTIWRLPTETEWEYACRAGTNTRFFWGMDDEFEEIDLYAWTSISSENQIKPIGQNLPNIWNLYDTCGNVYEWVADDYHSNLENAPINSMAWIDNPRSPFKVLKSGSALMSPEYSRISNRSKMLANNSAKDIGFRLLREAD